MWEPRAKEPRRIWIHTYLLFAHGADDGDKQVLAFIEVTLDLLAKVAIRDLDIIFGSTVSSHEVEETVVNVNLVRNKRDEKRGQAYTSRSTHKLEFVTEDVRDIHVMGGGRQIFL